MAKREVSRFVRREVVVGPQQREVVLDGEPLERGAHGLGRAAVDVDEAERCRRGGEDAAQRRHRMGELVAGNDTDGGARLRHRPEANRGGRAETLQD